MNSKKLKVNVFGLIFNHECSFEYKHYYSSWFFQLGFLVKKHPKVIGVKKTTLSIWISHFGHVRHDWAVKLGLVILTSKVMDGMTYYSTSR
jgi:hypothetical protein